MDEKIKVTNKCPICGRPTHKESKYCIFHASAEEKTEREFKEALKEYVKKIKKEDGDYDFKEFIFVGEINFKKDLNITIIKNANFEETIFGEYANFYGVIFKGSISFQEAIFMVGSIFDEVTFKGHAIFEKAIFKEQAYFRGAIFEGYADFKKVIFGVVHEFKKAIFKRHAFFQGAIFEGDAIFGKVIFKGDAIFQGVIFKGDVGFQGAIFERYAVFGEVIINEGFNYSKETLTNSFNYKKPTLKERDILLEALLFEINKFGKVVFEGNADFRGATFKNDAVFRESIFEDDADFRLKYLVKILYFSKIKVLSGKKIFIRLNDGGGKIHFEYAYLENIYLDLDLGKRVLIDFNYALLRNTKIERDQIENHILQEEKKDFSRAKKIYLLIKNNFHSIGKYDDESWAFKKEKDMERLSQSFPYYKATLKNENKKESLPILKWMQKGNFKKWITSAFSNMIYGYGEKPWNVIKTAVAIILIFALSFSFIGLGNPEIIELKGTAIHQNSGNMVDLVSKGLLKNNVIRNFPDSLYFSTITFTTLGYGDFRPLEGLGRILAGSEAFLGAIMMALFVYTFARRTGGR